MKFPFNLNKKEFSMKKAKMLSLTAGLVLAITFTLSCSDDGGGNDDGGRNELTPSSNSSGGETVFCKQTLGACSQLSLSTCMELVNAGAAQIVSSCDEPPPPPLSSSSNPPPPTPPSSSSARYLAFTDSRDGKIYLAVTIGTQTWMAENLNRNASGSKCYDNISTNCEKYGRLYNWSTASTVCPSGWHLPTDAEWTTLETFVGTNPGIKLKAYYDWENSGYGTDGTDYYDFEALPGGYGNSSGSFYDVGYYGYWWSASENYSSYAYSWYMRYSSATVDRDLYDKSYLCSVRCVQD
jgi:uncharacterized protein (TIGR02145 family)